MTSNLVIYNRNLSHEQRPHVRGHLKAHEPEPLTLLVRVVPDLPQHLVHNRIAATCNSRKQKAKLSTRYSSTLHHIRLQQQTRRRSLHLLLALPVPPEQPQVPVNMSPTQTAHRGNRIHNPLNSMCTAEFLRQQPHRLSPDIQERYQPIYLVHPVYPFRGARPRPLATLSLSNYIKQYNTYSILIVLISDLRLVRDPQRGRTRARSAYIIELFDIVRER